MHENNLNKKDRKNPHFVCPKAQSPLFRISIKTENEKSAALVGKARDGRRKKNP
jgi:hypothetical protein